MRTILIVLASCFWHAVNATTIYISSSSGNDSHSFTEAQDPSTPWKSIDKLNAEFGKLKPGDFILFKRGDTFYGSIEITKSGTAGAPITIGAYGSGDKPVVTGFNTVDDWVNAGGNIWESSSAVTKLSAVNMLTINGVQFAKGRYPNANAANKGYLTIDSHSGSNTVSSDQLPGSPEWKGAIIVLRTNHWVLDTCRVTDHSGKTVKFSPAATYEPKNGFGFFIEDHVKTLDQHGEWYFDPKTKKLRVYLSGNPSSYKIKVSSLEDIVECYNDDYITIQDVRIEGANRWGTYHYSASYNTIKNCDIVFSGDMAVNAAQADNIHFTVENSYISDAGNYGINCRFTGDNQVIRKNTIKNIGLFPGMGGVGAQHRTGFANTDGNNHIIENNVFDSIGYAGLKFGGNYTTIRNNVISNFTMVVDDAGGIYTGNQSGGDRVGCKVYNNLIFNGRAAIEGTTDETVRPSSGIYTDDNSSGIEIYNNSVWNCGKAGLYVHNSYNLNIHDNLFYNNGQAQVQFVHDNEKYAPLRNITFKDNIACSKDSDQRVAFYYTRLNDIGSFGKIDSNVYARPLNEKDVIIEITYLYTSNANTIKHTVDSWKKRYDLDKASHASPKTFATDEHMDDSTRFEYNPTGSDRAIGLDGTYMDLNKKVYDKTIKLAPYSAALLIKTRDSPNDTPTVKIDTPLNNATFKEPASVTIEASAADEDGKILKVDFYKNGSWIGTDNTAPYSFTWKDVPAGSYALTAKAMDDDSAVTVSDVLNIKVDTVKEDPTPVPNIAPSIQIAMPSGGSGLKEPASVTIEATAVDEDGKILKVDFYKNGSWIGTDNTAPYSYTWKNVPAGSYALTAKAMDDDSAVTVSDVLNIKVDTVKEDPTPVPNIAPSIQIAMPSGGSGLKEPASVTIEATAVDEDGKILKVDFYKNGSWIGTDNTAPYSFTWKDVPAGSYALTAKAMDDDSAVTVSDVLNIKVDTVKEGPTPVPNIAPSIQIAMPSGGSGLKEPASVTIEATAVDEDGKILKVDFYKNGSWIGTDNTAPYSFTWKDVPAGSYALTAKAMDDDSAVTVSDVLNIKVDTVKKDPPPVDPPPVQPDSVKPDPVEPDPVDPDPVDPDPVDPDPVDPDPVDPDPVEPDPVDPHPVDPTPANIPPSITIINPVANRSYEGYDTIHIAVSASDPDGKIARVNIWINNKIAAIYTKGPYEFVWSGIHDGDFTISAEAFDNNGAKATATPVHFNVKNPAPPVQSPDPVYTEFRIGPNPVANTLYITSNWLEENKPLKINILTSAGSIVQSHQVQTINAPIPINVTALKNGVYVLQATTATETHTTKFIKF